MNRIKFLSKTTLTVAVLFSLVLLGCANKQKKASIETTTASITEKSPFFKLSLAQWSLHKQIRNGEMSPLDFAQKASELGFEGIEYVSQLYRDELKKDADPQLAMEVLLKTLKQKSKTYNVRNVLIMVDGEGDLGTLDGAKREEAVNNHKKWVDAAKYLGCHSIRVNAKGVGTAEEVAKAAVAGLGKLSEYAEKQGINVLVENHGGYSSNGQWLADVMTRVGKLNCGTLPDFGNFCITKGYGSINDANCKDAYDIYKGVSELMPFAKAVSAKSYDFDENGKQPKIDYVKMLQVVKDAGFTGFIGVEYEGANLEEEAGIMATKKLLLSAAKELN
ncbi:MAG: sugar phosphate isomerase/epimerase [Labilibaculum sp.]|nr:sugar phosphate isomerase/epimerase [Labilibaculum sp.]